MRMIAFKEWQTMIETRLSKATTKWNCINYHTEITVAHSKYPRVIIRDHITVLNDYFLSEIKWTSMLCFCYFSNSFFLKVYKLKKKKKSNENYW